MFFHEALPHIFACVYVQSDGGLFLRGPPSDYKACICILDLIVGHWAVLPDNSDLEYEIRKKKIQKEIKSNLKEISC